MTFASVLDVHENFAWFVVIGNALGWSTLALAALLPESRVVALDAGFDRNSLEGLALTNRIAAAAGWNARAVKGVSPGDVAGVVKAELGGPVDFAFIDGLHTNAQIVLDHAAVEDVQPDGFAREQVKRRGIEVVVAHDDVHVAR